ncbi:hypothetical protein CDAR_471131 [Caerostris darwini]|uniref:Uncharacterized protein n=1 Tax=Caerostris darwini TaxID=1538125 RepID=A0AAV4QPA8_9ARAC|nr:hypothetical protein CDAR_471131 [Caerostris darwini]
MYLSCNCLPYRVRRGVNGGEFDGGGGGLIRGFLGTSGDALMGLYYRDGGALRKIWCVAIPPGRVRKGYDTESGDQSTRNEMRKLPSIIDFLARYLIAAISLRR